MGRIRHHVGGCVVGMGLMFLAGCTPGRQWTRGVEGQAPPPVMKTEEKPKVDDKPAPAAKPEVPPPNTQPIAASKPCAPGPDGYRLAGDDPLVMERITLFEEKKSVWDETASRLAELGTDGALSPSWHECLHDIEQALAGYGRLRGGQERDLNPWTIIQRDLHYFDQECDRVLSKAQAKVPGAQAAVPAPAAGSGGEQIRQYFEAGQYKEAVAFYETLAKSEEGALVPLEARVYSSRALVRLGRFQEAAAMLTEWLRETGPATDLAGISTRMLTADVLLAAGQVDEAREVYEGLAKVLSPVVSQQEWAAAHAQAFGEQVSGEDLDRYRGLIQAYLIFDGQRVPPELVAGASQLQGETAGTLSELARMVLAKAMAQAQAWARTQLAEARVLIDNHELARARELVEEVSAAAPAEMRSAISQIQEEIARAEAAELETAKTAGEPRAASPWEEALHLFEQQKYDEAIAAFKKLVDGEQGVEAKAKMTEAIELAAAAMRRQAAALFAKARKTFDPEAKRQALLSSRTLLVELIDKYPEASIIAKARQNLKVLDAELGKAEPPSVPVPAPADAGASDSP